MSVNRDRLHEIINDYADEAYDLDLEARYPRREVYDAVDRLHILIESIAQGN